ncbi:chemotaxis protein CheY [Paenibacillus sp. FSL R7-0273]|uniref:sensor domain-containing diguanylate cyclase n=1 Tax=Paenibacillus sp. FSL R7-0273 TaxID=1536772 RepID=UPI0004F755BA|nr:sensor domain-containing diguanylate cyclase [Paenibacillus sp. FSL R7-0273]AIQ49951.1 chemotaxis protein CheY [Paenibacillus sp. FSL R7-0273]OMF84527.1 PAS domain S-box protein [Paenibacillus sp. FSL R7-0273]
MDERLEFAPCGYLSITHQGIITDMNHTFLYLMGYTREALLHKHIESIMSKANQLVFHSYFYPNINLHGHVEELFISLKDGSGGSVPYIMNGRSLIVDGVAVIDCVLVQMSKRIDYEQELRSAKKQIEEAYWAKDQALAGLNQIHAEIQQKQQELMELNAVLVELSTTDKLTGLKNRRYFEDMLSRQLELFRETGEPFSLLIIDIDHFKRINDTFGHQTGDYVLEKLGSLLRFHSREKDTAARYGGEEFVLILPDLAADEARLVAENLRLETQLAVWETGSLTVSAGIATCADGDTGQTLLHKADKALYASKEGGRNRVTHSLDCIPEVR